MTGKPRIVFVEKHAYRRRRMEDAARLMPLLGAGLILLPLLWKGGGEDGATRTVDVMLYLFLVWVFLAGAAAIISRRLSPADPDTTGDGTG